MAEVPGDAHERDWAAGEIHHRERGAGGGHQREHDPRRVNERDEPPDPDEPPDALEQPRIRKIRDARVLRAVAHPVRLRILDELLKDGPLTATELAERLGESPANCSWHLRQLARYGFIEEAEGGTGRQRPWRLAAESHLVSREEAGPEFARARDTLVEVLFERALREYRGWWLVDRHREPPQWQGASFAVHSVGFFTAEELAEFRRELDDLFTRHFLAPERLDPARRTPDTRPVRFVAWAFPSGRSGSSQPPTHPDD